MSRERLAGEEIPIEAVARENGGPSSPSRRHTLAVAAALFLVFGLLILARYRPLTWLVGDGPYYAETAVSLLHDHDLDLRNQLPGGLVVHGPQIALGPEGQWFPKHPILLPVLGLPFLAAFGLPGLLLLNLLVLTGFGVLLFRLGCTAAPPAAAAGAVGLLLFGTFARSYAYNLSPDLLATALVAAGLLAALERRFAAAGLLFGAAVFAKPLFLVLLPPAILFVALTAGIRPFLRFAAGGLLPACGLALLNLTLFGSPFTTSYDRNVVVTDGVAQLTTQRERFDHDFLLGARGMLLDPKHGIVPTAPALLLALPGFLLFLRRRPAQALWLGISGALLFLVLCRYRYWAESHYGNRYLMPLLVFATPGLALLLDRVARRWAPRRRVDDAPERLDTAA